ncbi:MAG: response regulator [Candidatus Aureabacteria bacterium]|nr:response regulator [Candidatus Auribacterota bacterium]
MAKILIVDDSFTTRKFIAHILKKSGFEIVEADNGESGLKSVKEEKPDLVILDIVMPEKEGIDTILVLKNTLPDLPIIAISGSSINDTYLSSAKKFGANAVLAKPFEESELIETIKEVMA